MTSNVVALPMRDGKVPADTFAIRLAIVRAVEGWNYDQASAATGINSETWRLWEKGKRRCTRLEETCRTISAATGLSYQWLMIGGSLADPQPPDNLSGDALVAQWIELPPSKRKVPTPLLRFAS